MHTYDNKEWPEAVLIASYLIAMHTHKTLEVHEQGSYHNRPQVDATAVDFPQVSPIVAFLPTQVGADPDHVPGGDSQVLNALPSS